MSGAENAFHTISDIVSVGYPDDRRGSVCNFPGVRVMLGRA
ncbi:hypothetical protein OHA40_08535 [Nocardia sp. NBC_00508]|nr:hypothetical protein [Nocardia sp. NBC_00508]WUD68150.1 hypothetical protein OHA40_08535 [Nocardia sp. NBC_00508]